MKLIVIGAEGTVGTAACDELAARHEIIKVGRDPPYLVALIRLR